MKLKFYIKIMLISVALLNMQAKTIGHKNEIIIEGQDKYLCYCSDKCGPREVKAGDTPFFDEEHGVCFCKQRDKDNYIPNRCDKKSKQNFNSICSPTLTELKKKNDS